MSPKAGFQFQVSKFKSQEGGFEALEARNERLGSSSEVLGSRDEKRVSSYWGLELRAKIDFNVMVLFLYGLRPGRFVVVINHGESLRSVKTFNLK